MLTLSLALLFKRRYFILSLISIICLVLGSQILFCWGSVLRLFPPLILRCVPYALSIIDVYLSKAEIITLTVILVLVLIGIIIIAIRAPKHKEKIQYLRSIIVVATLSRAGGAVSVIGSQTRNPGITFWESGGSLKIMASLLPVNSFIDTGIKSRKRILRETMNGIINDLNQDDGAEDAATPNIIFYSARIFLILII